MAGQAEVVHRALDGSRFRLGGDLELDGAATSTADLVTGRGLSQFTSGSTGLGADMARAAGVGGFDEELSYQGGALRVGRKKIYDTRARLSEDLLVAAWVGERYSLVTHLYNGSTERLLGLLRTLRIEEHADGVTVLPAPRSGTTFRGPAAVVKPVRGLGLLEIRTLTPQLARELPSWSGMRVGSGELFRDTVNGDSTYFLLATPRIHLTVLPLADTRLDAVPQLLGRLKVEGL